MIDQRFGRYLVIGLDTQPRKKTKGHGERRWIVRCDCGQTRSVIGSLLRKGAAQSCGCLQIELARAKALRHGCSNDLTYSSWRAVKRRCLDESREQFPKYGGAGIAVCARWRDSFESFLSDMGQRPSRLHTIDRVDNSKGYEPGNCRWATKREQALNRRDTILVTVGEETLCIAEWSRRSGVTHGTILRRVHSGWDARRAVFEPATRRRPWADKRRKAMRRPSSQ
jgi:hypothetical protein